MVRLTPSGLRPTSMPPMSAVPAVGFNKPHIMRIVVDLPAPFAPRKPKISPCFTENDRSLTATNDPKVRLNPWTSIAAAVGVAAVVDVATETGTEGSWLMGAGPAHVQGAPPRDGLRPTRAFEPAPIRAARPGPPARRCWSPHRH